MRSAMVSSVGAPTSALIVAAFDGSDGLPIPASFSALTLN